MEFDIRFAPETEDEKEEARKQRCANATDGRPELAARMTGKTWPQIFALTAEDAN